MSSSTDVVFYPCLEWLESTSEIVLGDGPTYLAIDARDFEFVGGTTTSLALVTTSANLMANIRVEDTLQELVPITEFPVATRESEAGGGLVAVSNKQTLDATLAKRLLGQTVFLLKGEDRALLGVVADGTRGLTPKAMRDRVTEIFFSGGTDTEWHVAVGAGADVALNGGTGGSYWAGGSNCFAMIGVDSSGELLDFVSTSVELLSKDRSELENPASTTVDFPLLMGSDDEDFLLAYWRDSSRRFDAASTMKDMAKVLATFQEPWIDVQIAEYTPFNFPEDYEYDQVYLYTSGTAGEMVAFVAQLDEPTDKQLGRILISTEVPNLLVI